MIAPKKSDMYNFTFTEQELIDGLSDPTWRLNNLYRIVDADKKVVIFRQNEIQKHLVANMHYRNLVLKSRKTGISTQTQLTQLDTALFSPNERCRVIAQDLKISESIFRDVLKFAYEGLPDPLKSALPTDGEPSKGMIEFQNGSIVEVSTNARGTTPTFLHVSEFGKIAAKDPGSAREIITGAITAVAKNGIIVVESTAEGQEGAFYEMVQKAQALQDLGRPLYPLEFKLFFFGWHQDSRNIAPEGIAVISPKDKEYFDDLETKLGKRITAEQRTWYVSFRENVYAGDQDMMFQEQPATPEEAFKVSLEGAYFTSELKRARKEGRICYCPYDPQYAVSVFFDIGANDLCSVFAIQPRGAHFAVLRHYEASGEAFIHFVREVDSWGYALGYVYLPHDANHRRQGAERNLTPEEMFAMVAPHWRFQIVPKTSDKMMAITQARNFFNMCIFDEANCKDGLKHLTNYRKEWNPRTGTYRNTPRHGPESNAADAFLQAAQAHANGMFTQYSGNMVGGMFDAGFSSYLEPPNLDF